MPDQKIYAFICTRSRQLTSVTKHYLSYLAKSGVMVKLLVNQDSIFSGYKKAFISTNPNPDDIIILSHDDIRINLPFTSLVPGLKKALTKDTGFVGVAGTTYLDKDLVWWDQKRWQQGYHRGAVYHAKGYQVNSKPTSYGPAGQVVCLDGLFLAARAKVLEEIDLAKPNYLEGDWDFYDIHYTLSAHARGYKNKAMLMPIVHYSVGELTGRDSWHKNRNLLYNKYEKELPIRC